MEYNDEQKKFIYTVFCEKLEQALENENLGNALDRGRDDSNVPMWKNLCFILDRLNSGEFCGVMSLRISGFRCSDVTIEKQTFKMEGEYITEDEQLRELGM